MDTELAMKLTDIVKEIGDTKLEIMSEVGDCKRDIALIKQKLTSHLKAEEDKVKTKERRFDKKTVVFGIALSIVGIVAVIGIN